MTANERIKQEAEDYANSHINAEYDRAQMLVDALDQFISYHETGLLPAKHVYEKAVAAREQWKSGKEVGG